MIGLDCIARLTARLPSPLVPLKDSRLNGRRVRVYLKRDDLIHPELSGNKWRKLVLNLKYASDQGYDTILTFGGAYSNHIRATAFAGSLCGFRTVGVIRGEEHLPLNESLAAAVGNGMRLIYLDRATYRRKARPSMLRELSRRFDDCYVLPEGGSNVPGVFGCREIPGEIDIPFDVMCCACGTGGTLAGISAGLTGEQWALGFSVLKGGSFLARRVAALQRVAFGSTVENYSIIDDFHFGGYARRNKELDDFIEEFNGKHAIRLNWIYEAKMMYGLYVLVSQGVFEPGSTIVAVLAG